MACPKTIEYTHHAPYRPLTHRHPELVWRVLQRSKIEKQRLNDEYTILVSGSYHRVGNHVKVANMDVCSENDNWDTSFLL